MHSQAKLEPMLVFGDAHRPYHDERAWQLMLTVGRKLRPTHLICMGDLADFYAVSSHSKNPLRVRQLADEIKDVRKGLDELDALKAKYKKFIAGNHCDRLTRYLQDKAPELFNVVGISELLQLEERGWEYTSYKDDTDVGAVHFTHDVGASGRNAAFKALDTYQHSVVTGHTHRMQYLVEGNATGEVKLSAQFGWLGDRNQIDYMHRAKVYKDWALGFGVGYINSNSGIVYLTPVPIIEVQGSYTCMVNGVLYQD
jgi:predicted phosphodiesterase